MILGLKYNYDNEHDTIIDDRFLMSMMKLAMLWNLVVWNCTCMLWPLHVVIKCLWCVGYGLIVIVWAW